MRQNLKQQQDSFAAEARELERQRASMEQARQLWATEQEQAAKQKAALESQVRAQQQMLVEIQQQHAQQLQQPQTTQFQSGIKSVSSNHDDDADADADIDDATFDGSDMASGPVTPRAKPEAAVFAITPRSGAKRDVHAELAQEREARMAAEEELQRLRLSRTGEVGV